jgi:ADP-heptose:LPS heptosyltransferase
MLSISNPDEIKNILVIQLGPFGDLLLTTSYFESLKKRFRNCKITYLTKRNYRVIVNDHPFIDHFLLVEKKGGLSYLLERIRMIFTIRKLKFDIVIDQQNKISSKQFTLLSGATYRVGYKDSKYDFVYNIKSPRGEEGYSPSKKFDMVKPLGIEKGEYRLYYTVNDDSREYIDGWLKEKSLKRLLIISPGSPVKWKKWDIVKYAEVADRLFKSHNLDIVWLWGPGEEDDAKKGVELMKERSFLAPKTSLNQAAALFEKGDLLLCNDGGMNHLAVTTGIKTIALFGGTDPKVWSPASEFKTHHHLHNPNHYHKFDSSFGIESDQLYSKSIEVLGE